MAGLKTITSTILVLASRSLKLILWLIPFIKAHFHGNFNFVTSYKILSELNEHIFSFVFLVNIHLK